MLKYERVNAQHWQAVEEKQNVKYIEPEASLWKILPSSERRFISHGCPVKMEIPSSQKIYSVMPRIQL